MGQRTKQTFLQRRHTDGLLYISHEHMKRCSTSLIIREMQINITVRYHLRLVRMAAIKKSTNNKCWRGCGEKRMLLHCWWECKLIQPLWKMVWKVKVKVKLLSCVRLFVTPWTIVHQAPPSMGFSRQEYWSGLPFPTPGNPPDPGIDSRCPHCRRML